jgi:hypothetical protein
MSRQTSLPHLINHRRLAERLDVDTETLRGWVERGEFPRPSCVVSRTWLYHEAVVAQWVASGTWPEGVRFNSQPSSPETPSPNA